jgi:hypothetical protein
MFIVRETVGNRKLRVLLERATFIFRRYVSDGDEPVVDSHE